jgi:hypothetical protein
MSEDGRLTDWIDALRGRLAQGDLAGLGPIDVGDGTGHLSGEITIRVLLADLDDLDDPDGSWRVGGARAERRRDLDAAFGRLRALIG